SANKGLFARFGDHAGDRIVIFLWITEDLGRALGYDHRSSDPDLIHDRGIIGYPVSPLFL
ncbi:MAG: hypothetical protein ACRC4H_10165, partial [Plesiomonas sp.]